MKLSLTIATLLLSLSTLAQTATSQKNCSCKAADGSCTASVTCSQHGCTAICGTNSACYSACGKDLLSTRFTLKLRKKGSKQIASALSQHTGRNIEFVPTRRNDRFNIDIEDDDMWNTMEYLYQRGKLRVNGVDWREYRKLRRATSDGGKMSLDFNDISVRDALNHLSFLTGLHFRVESGDAEKLISISLREVTLDEIISRISTETGIRIEQAKKRPSIK